MLVATMTILLLVFGVGGSGDVSILEMLDNAIEAVQEIVGEDAKREKIQDGFRTMRKNALEFRDEVWEGRRKLLDLDLDYGTTREQYEEAFRALDASWEKREAVALDRFLAIRGELSMDEWRRLFVELQEKRE